MFQATQFMTANDKEKTVEDFRKFVNSLTTELGKTRIFKGINIPSPFAKFTNRIYEHLHLHCGFIAHYNINGFYGTYFNGEIADFERFLIHFIEDDNGILRFNYIFDSEYGDINKAFTEILNEKRSELLKAFNKNTIEDVEKQKEFLEIRLKQLKGD